VNRQAPLAGDTVIKVHWGERNTKWHLKQRKDPPTHSLSKRLTSPSILLNINKPTVENDSPAHFDDASWAMVSGAGGSVAGSWRVGGPPAMRRGWWSVCLWNNKERNCYRLLTIESPSPLDPLIP
jgi:hypothetical protein